MQRPRKLRPLALVAVLGALALPDLHAQMPLLPADSVALHDLAGFADPPGNWRVVGDVAADRDRDLRISTEAGTGILVNVAGSGSGADLHTAWEHGDIDLELEFMMPRASNSGIYLQGRYELQLLDSWRKEHPNYGDMGGIYQRWDEARGAGRQGYEGHAPRVNAARAPGLWQQLRIEFRAPRFDAQGRKVENARFVRVELNGSVLHENVEMTGPTRGAVLPGEAATGPIRIQGDHGPIAFRNIRYKRYGVAPLALSGLHYRVLEGAFDRLPEIPSAGATRGGVADGLTASAAGVADRFALIHEGMIEVPTSGRYLLDLRLNWLDTGAGAAGQGGARLSIAGRDVLIHDGARRAETAEVELTAGTHPFTLRLYKNREGRPASIALFAEGPGVRRQALHADPGGARGTPAGAIRLQPRDEPYVLRSFVNHGEEKRTHVISVGEPSAIHYSFDARQGALLSVWRGPFLETTEMWSGRGEPQLAVPLGSVLTLSGAPALAQRPDPSAPWPDSMAPAARYTFLGYDLDADRRPVFRYRLAGVTVEDRIRPLEDGSGFRRELRMQAPEGTAGLQLRLAAGEEVVALRDGAFVVDGSHYVQPARGAGSPAILAAPGDRQELVLPVSFRRGEATVTYDIVW